MTPAVPGWAEWGAEVAPYVAEAAFFSAVAFIAAYTILAKWWQTSLGITIVLLDLMIAVTLFPDILSSLFGVSVAGSEAFTFTTLGAIAAVPVIIAWRFAILLRAQLGHHGKRDTDA
jgi:hypothetical protein